MNRTIRSLAFFAAGILAISPLAFSQTEGQGQGTAIVTVLPKQPSAPAPNISEQSIHVSVDGREGQVTNWQPLHGTQSPVELVLLIDEGARASLGSQFRDITQFIRSLPPNVKVTLGYMEYGRAVLAGPLTVNHASAAQKLHLPVSLPGQNASPYFCLSDLAKNWPSGDRSARREVIMITDGVDYYHPQYDPEDPYVQAAMQDAVHAHLVVYTIYWRNTGRFDRSWYANDEGQNLLLQVAQATGGNSYWIGFGNPVSLSPYFDDFSRRLNNQYELGFATPLPGKAQMEDLKVKVPAPGAQVTAPQKTWIAPPEVAQR